jgi:hypothetical protein
MEISLRPNANDNPETRAVKREVSLMVAEISKDADRLRGIVQSQAMDDSQLDEPDAQGVSIRQSYAAMKAFLLEVAGLTIPDLTEP